jgi:hypothetical protein
MTLFQARASRNTGHQNAKGNGVSRQVYQPGGVDMSDRHSLVSADICARALDITRGCLYRMARQGLVPSYRVGVQQRGLRFDVEEVKAALRRDDAQDED